MEQTDKEKTIANAEIHLNDAGIFADMFISSSHYYAVVQFFAEHETQVIPLREQLKDMTQMQDDLIKAWDQEKANKQVYIDQLNGSTTTILELRERLEKVEKENEQLTQWHRDWVSGKWVKEQTANIDRLIKENERLREKSIKN